MTCKRCCYWIIDEDTVKYGERHEEGLCRRFPPRFITSDDNYGYFPRTYAAQWCGEFRDKELGPK
jgi:hypothetical protein